MNAATILKAKGREVVTVRPEVSLLEASRTLARHGIGCLVVLERAGKTVGILSERDIVRAVAEGGPERLASSVQLAMSSPVHTAREADTIDQLMAEMTSRRFRHLPIVEGDQLVGLVSIGDVVKLRIAEAEMEAEAMRNYIVAR